MKSSIIKETRRPELPNQDEEIYDAPGLAAYWLLTMCCYLFILYHRTGSSISSCQTSSGRCMIELCGYCINWRVKLYVSAICTSSPLRWIQRGNRSLWSAGCGVKWGFCSNFNGIDGFECAVLGPLVGKRVRQGVSSNVSICLVPFVPSIASSKNSCAKAVSRSLEHGPLVVRYSGEVWVCRIGLHGGKESVEMCFILYNTLFLQQQWWNQEHMNFQMRQYLIDSWHC